MGDLHQSAIAAGVSGTPLQLDFGSLGQLSVENLPPAHNCKVCRAVMKCSSRVSDCYHYCGGCGHDALRAVVERVFQVRKEGGQLGDPPSPVDDFNHLTGHCLREFRPLQPVLPAKLEDVPLMMNGAKRRLYEKALATACLRKVRPSDACLSAFVKVEAGNYTRKQDVVPRLIQPRSPLYNLHVARFLKPNEHCMYRKAALWKWNRPTTTPIILKCYDGIARANIIKEKCEAIGADFVAVGTDMSRFDQHTSPAALKWEHSMYLEYFHYASSNDKSELKSLLKMQLKNRGFVRCKDGTVIKYTRSGCRMSGDMNTALGNCLIMAGLLYGLHKKLGIVMEVVCDGDDAVTIMHKSDLPKFMEALGPHFLAAGYTANVESVAEELEKIEFCQCRPVFNGETHIMCRNPFKAISNDMQGVGKWTLPHLTSKMLSAVGQGGGHLCVGIPVMQSFYKGMRLEEVDISQWDQDSGFRRMAMGVVERYKRKYTNVPERAISCDARVSFYNAFGVDPDTQRALELFIPTPRVGPICHIPAELWRLRLMTDATLRHCLSG